MKNILIVESSPMAEGSHSRKATRKLESRLRAKYPEAKIVHRDVASSPLPHLDGDTLKAFSAGGKAAELSDLLTAELLSSDLVVIASPMWNYGVPSSLKAWIDHVARPGKSFAYTEKGPVGLIRGKRAILVTASGGFYGEGPMKAMDFVEPYLRSVLRFMGIEDVQTVRVEGTAVSASAAGATAEKSLELLAI